MTTAKQSFVSWLLEKISPVPANQGISVPSVLPADPPKLGQDWHCPRCKTTATGQTLADIKQPLSTESPGRKTPISRQTPEKTQQPSQPAKNPAELLKVAWEFCRRQNWSSANACATEIIQINPSLTDAYMCRAFAVRAMGSLDAAISDYSRVIEMDPQNGNAWMFRGACKMQKASGIQDRPAAINLMNDAHPDYQRAAELKPEDEQAGLALLELEICIGKYREAIGTTGVWWNRIESPEFKAVCAWLGAIALILAGRPETKWIHFRQFLEESSAQLEPSAWSVAEISGVINSLTQNKNFDQERLLKIQSIHTLFLKHFVKGGPILR
ncbi:MAG: tetratricopeptide repeat protein [Verrucomicrobia bacterium]|nr:tetratricopeptide repeat protein [Verrucomicrobiota bacterium]